APAFRLHIWHNQSRGVERSSEIDGDNRIPLFGREFLDRRDILDTGIVYEDIDLAELVFGGVDHIGNVIRLADIGIAVADANVVLARQSATQFLYRSGIAKAVEHDVGAVLGQNLGNAPSDAAGRSSNECGFSGKHLPTPHMSPALEELTLGA